jgi:hypothetical protein
MKPKGCSRCNGDEIVDWFVGMPSYAEQEVDITLIACPQRIYNTASECSTLFTTTKYEHLFIQRRHSHA